MPYRSSQNALVLAPHPDDETLGCGGTIRLITSAGGRADVVFLTRGEIGVETGSGTPPAAQAELARQRTFEAAKACRTLGVQSHSFLGGVDGRLKSAPELAAHILNILHTHEYRSVFCPWRGETHDDHAATFRLLQTALRQYPREIEVWLYEIWTPLTPNMLIPIDSTIKAKREAIQAYASQLEMMDYLNAFLALAQYRSLLCRPAKYAEAFYVCDREAVVCGDLPDLAAPELLVTRGVA